MKKYEGIINIEQLQLEFEFNTLKRTIKSKEAIKTKILSDDIIEAFNNVGIESWYSLQPDTINKSVDLPDEDFKTFIEHLKNKYGDAVMYEYIDSNNETITNI